MLLAGCDNGENKRLKAEIAELKNGIAEKNTIVQGSVNEYGRAADLPSVRLLLARPELKGIFVPEEGITQAEAAQSLATLSHVAGVAAGMPGVGANEVFFNTVIKTLNQLKHDIDLGVDSRAYADRYYSKDYSYIVVSLATSLLKEGLIITEAGDISTGCIIKAKSSKNKFFSLPQEYTFVVQPSEHGIRVFGASTTKHKFYSLDKPEQSLNKIFDKVG